jgi:hypothetical protein
MDVMHDLIFACMPAKARQTMVLIRSLRTFGGQFAHRPVWVLVPAREDVFSAAHQADLARLDARLISFEVDTNIRAFPFAAKVLAAAYAESLAQTEKAERLVWMDSDTLVIQEPNGLLIPPETQLGYCPVHHRLIGSRLVDPLDAFWALVYETCDVPPERVFAMRTIIDEVDIRPYINAGCMVTRPETSLLRAWSDRFRALYRDARFEAFYEQHALYRIFIHQALLAGVMMARLTSSEMIELSRRFNYPLHLYADHASANRPTSINDLITCRYESVFNEPGWQDRLPITGELKGWIESQFASGP